MDTLLTGLATRAPKPHVVESLEGFWTAHRAEVRRVALPIDRAVIGGFYADRLGYAFAAGYQAALVALVPELDPDTMSSFCVSEQRGNHPRAVETQVTPIEGGFRIDGLKRWATGSPFAKELLVVGRLGEGGERPALVTLRVPVTTPGLTVKPWAEAVFVPELPHAEVELRDVRVSERALLPGDGYERHVRPFRTVEDVHVLGAVLGMAVAELRRRGDHQAAIERIFGMVVALRGIASLSPSSPAAHLALSGAFVGFAALRPLLDEHFAALGGEAGARWERDRALLDVASKAREARRLRAWERLNSGVPAPSNPR